jgi:hypothetical protein
MKETDIKVTQVQADVKAKKGQVSSGHGLLHSIQHPTTSSYCRGMLDMAAAGLGLEFTGGKGVRGGWGRKGPEGAL